MEDSILFRRQSRRAYLDKAVGEEVLDRIYEKIRWSPSCSNNQPWRFIFVSNPAQHAKFMEALPRGNQWAARAPVLIAVCARQADDHTREDDPVAYYQFDCGLAVMSLLLAAVEEGLMAHPMAGYDAAKLHDVLDIPDEYHLICIIALGYQGSPELLDERQKEAETAPRIRKQVSEIIAQNRFDF